MRIVSHEVSSEIDTLPGNSSVAVFHSATNFGERGKGNGTLVHSECLTLVREFGYQFAICTTDASNEPEIKILQKFGWTEVTRFVSKRTGYTVILWNKNL